MAKIIIRAYKDPSALKKPDKVSDKRGILFDHRETALLRIEMDDEEGWALFHDLPQSLLPLLPPGYEWARSKNGYSIIRSTDAEEYDLTLIIYGPDKRSLINFVFQVDGISTYSFAHSKKAKGPTRSGYPMYSKEYNVLDYNYSESSFKNHVRGHLIDHQDTIIDYYPKEKHWSTYDPRNYVPEPPQREWGLNFRNQKVKCIREAKGAYAQFNVYADEPLETDDGTPVPGDVRFINYAVHPDYKRLEVYHVKFDEDLTRPKDEKVLDYADSHFMTSIESTPVVTTWESHKSDRDVRTEVRAISKREQEIAAHTVKSRYPKKDGLLWSLQAADKEFLGIGKGLHAAFFAHKTGRETLTTDVLVRTLSFGEALVKQDQEEIINESDVEEATRFFKKLVKSRRGADTATDFQDRYSKIVSDSMKKSS